MAKRISGPAREFCADTSRETAEGLAATASVADRWILVEYRGVWSYDAIEASGLGPDVKAHLRERARTLGRTKVLFIRSSGRRRKAAFRLFWGSCAERGASLRGTEVERYDELLDLDFDGGGDTVDHPLLLVCTHGKHDPCCARYGRPLYQAIAEQAEEGWAWQCSHVGGDRFAGNLVILPEGLYFGHLDPGEAWTVLDEYLAGRIRLRGYRGRSCHSFAVQAAELAVREQTGEALIDGLELVSLDPIRFRARGRTYEVEVERTLGELTYLTCSAAELKHPRRYVARILPERVA
jgi:hypothetical protein